MTGLQAWWSALVPPARRTQGLVLASMDDELLVYDEERHRAHALNATAAQVLEQCDGSRSVKGVARQLAQARGGRAAQLPQAAGDGSGAGGPASSLRPPRWAAASPLESGPVLQAVALLAVLQLGRARLLSSKLGEGTGARLPTRREVLQMLGQGAAALPVVSSIIAPTAADAISCSLVSCATQPCCITKLCSGPPNYLCLG